MTRTTIKELEEKLKNAQKTIDKQKNEIVSLKTKLEIWNEEIEFLLEKVKASDETIIMQNKLLGIGIKAEHNSRGAGRKEFQDYETVKNIFHLCSNGESLQGIANKLNEANIKTKAGGKWSKSSVRFILLNKSYVKKGIIDESVFKLINERRKAKK